MAGRPATLAIRVTATTAAARAQLASLERSLDRFGNSALTAGRSLAKVSALMAGGLGFAPIAAAAAAAAAGLGAFAAAAGPQMKKVATATELYAKAQEQALTDTKAAAETMKEYQAQLKAMPAATRATTEAVIKFKDAWASWSDSMAPDVMPVFTKALQGLTAALPGLTPLVKAATDALLPFVESFKTAAENGAVERFSTQLAAFAGPAMGNLLTSVKNLAIGFANLFLAFGDETAVSATQGLADLTARFREWSETAQQSEGFQKVVSIAEKMWETFLLLVPVAFELGGALLPMVQTFADLALKGAEFLAALPADTLDQLAAAVIAAAAAVALLKLGMEALNLVMKANPVIAVIAALALLAAGLVYAYQRSEGFREIVSNAFNQVKIAVAALSLAYQNNKDWIDPLINKAKELAFILVGSLGVAIAGSIIMFAKIVNAIGATIDAVRRAIRIVSELVAAFNRTITLVMRITGLDSILDAVRNVKNALSSLPGVKSINLASRAAPTARTLLAVGAAPTAQPSPPPGASPVHLAVTIDGQQLQYRIDRSIRAAMLHDGARLAAGGWA